MTDVRRGQAPAQISRAEFAERFQSAFRDPAFAPEKASLARIEEIAWQAFKDERKSPVTRKAGPGYADPDYDLPVDWRATHDAVAAAQAAQADPASPSRVLMIVGAARNDGSCPGEISKTFRLATWMTEELQRQGMAVDTLDLSLTISEYGRRILPCKACVSTAMPLCHWPCSCYPNHALGQTGDWMNEIYPRWAAAHGVIIASPVYWYQSPSALKLMIDRLVCADGGNPDPSSTHGKDAAAAKALELQGWDYPQHLAGRVYGLLVHGDVAGVESSRRNLVDWLDWMGLVDAGEQSRLDRYIGYWRPYATSHEDLDLDLPVQQEARNLALSVAHAVKELRTGTLAAVQARLRRPRPK